MHQSELRIGDVFLSSQHPNLNERNKAHRKSWCFLCPPSVVCFCVPQPEENVD